ncbi:MAG: M14 family metallopeptidase [marine benthic group bacterium]|nr:M14 family metallopeptidase [Gemmatimonadota bacterium]MCL7967735.1 M14 family metallopeptidase [Gemmatimonadota bacterium]MCL7974619.1 M14 family metallopeptidase [Gemmatimonadota bacterium]MCL7977382.1 M14 family metallopeptidase [Gemmatimonadota bacterium]
MIRQPLKLSLRARIPALLALCTAAVAALSPSAALAQTGPPSPAEHLGYELGQRFASTNAIESYGHALAAGSPVVHLEQYGVTPEGRSLFVLVIGHGLDAGDFESDLARLQLLTDPKLSPNRAREIARETRAVVWLTYGIHGDESSSSQAALWTAWDLATGRAGLDGVLDSLIVVIDPVANPDGRDRYVNWYRSVRGEVPNPEVSSAEHRQPWPGGRYNHYLFDLNRDWTWASQPETQARLAEFDRWHPAVHVDFHEMGHESSYFFFPAAAPISPLYPESTARWAERFGRANAAEFDRRRWLYFTAEQFDLFYPGYGDSWPSLVGAIGMTYEQAGGGRAGLVVRRHDGELLKLADRIERHRVAGISTLRTAAAGKTDLLHDFARFHSARDEAAPDFIVVPDQGGVVASQFSRSLVRQGIEVERATGSFEASAEPHPGFVGRSDFPEGTLLVRADQRRGRLARTLLQADVPHPTDGPGRTYDITAWSLPYAFGLETHSASRGVDGTEMAPVDTLAFDRAPNASGAALPLGWLVAPSWQSSGPLVAWLRAGGRARALEGEFELGGRKWPAGTRLLQADAEAAERLSSAGLAPFAVPVTTGWAEEGRDLGTSRSFGLRAPRIGVFRGSGTWATSFGSAWYFLERMADVPFDALELEEISGLRLSEWDVLVLPDGRPGRFLDEQATGALRSWLESGGTLVTFAGAAHWASRSLAEIELREAEADSLSEEDRRAAALRTREERREDRWDRSVNGVILPVRMDSAHPLAWGAGLGNSDRRMFVLHLSDILFEPSGSFETVVALESGVRNVSGVVSESKLEELGGTAWLASVRVGRGQIVLFADDPLFRLMWPSQFVLFMNALLLGPNMG